MRSKGQTMNRTVTILAFSLGAAWGGYNGGGNFTAFEKGDAIYREGAFELGLVDDYHSGMIGKFMMHEGKPVMTMSHLTEAKDKSKTGVFNGLTVKSETYDPSTVSVSTETNGNLFVKDLRVLGWRLGITDPNVPHSKNAIDALGKGVFKLWGDYYRDEYASQPVFRGIYQSRTAIEDGSLTSAKRNEILDEVYGGVAYWARRDDWSWDAANLVNYNGEWEMYGIIPYYSTYFRGLYDIDDTRCEFLIEWAYEKRGIRVWGQSTSSHVMLSGGSTEDADYHNDAVDNNAGYTLDEMSPMVQAGDFFVDTRNSQSRTTMRPSLVEPPVIEYFWQSSSGPKFKIRENASHFVYYSILLYDASGNFVRYAKDDQGNDYTYRQLYLSQDQGKVRSQILYPSKNSGDNWNAYTVRLVVTDEGANTSELNFAQVNSELPQNLTIQYLNPSSGLAPSPYRAGSDVRVYCNFLNSGSPCHFNSILEENIFTINGIQATITGQGTDEVGKYIEIGIPKGATSGPIVFATNGAKSNPLSFTILPTIESISPSTAVPGETVTLYGHDFPAIVNRAYFYKEENGGNSSSSFISTSSVTRVNENIVKVVVPAGAYRGLTLVTGESSTSGGHWAPLMDFLVTPKITLLPKATIPGRKIRIEGQNFSLTPEVRIGGEQATVVASAKTWIDVIVPKKVGYGSLPVSVINRHTHCKYFSWPDDNSYCSVRPVMESSSNAELMRVNPNMAPILSILLE